MFIPQVLDRILNPLGNYNNVKCYVISPVLPLNAVEFSYKSIQNLCILEKKRMQKELSLNIALVTFNLVCKMSGKTRQLAYVTRVKTRSH